MLQPWCVTWDSLPYRAIGRVPWTILDDHWSEEEFTMGLLDAFKGEVQRNFIARPEEAKGQIVYQYPERNIRMLSQVTVNADEVCLFVHEGIVHGTLGPGRHQLDTQNIPFVGALLEQFTAGNLFVAQVYFVTMREIPDVKFGGPIGDVRDPDSGLGIGTMVYGDFSVQVTDPSKLVLGLAGLKASSNDELLNWFRTLVLKVTRDRIAELCVKKQWPLLNVTSGAYTEEIEADLLAGVGPTIESYGLRVVRFGNFTVTIKPEDEATLKKMTKDVAYSKLAGGFQQYAQGQAMLGAAEGMAKGSGEGSGGALGGMGMGMGFGMANMFAGQQAGRGNAAPAATRTVTDRLKELTDLKASGMLTEEEFSAKKAELMKEL